MMSLFNAEKEKDELDLDDDESIVRANQGGQPKNGVNSHREIGHAAEGIRIVGNSGKPEWMCIVDTDNCRATFATREMLNQHVASHSVKKGYFCPECSETFFTSQERNKHMRRIHVEQSEQIEYVCDLPTCRKQFRDAYALKCHMRFHNNERNFKCDICPIAFFTAEDLRKHSRAHTGTAEYRCTECSQKFKWPGSLKRHMKTHTMSPAHVCTVCNKRFAEKFELKRHAASHSKEKFFTCPLCKKNYNRKDRFKSHMKTHNQPEDRNGEPVNQTVLVCPFASSAACTERFVEKSLLINHLKTQHTSVQLEEASISFDYYEESLPGPPDVPIANPLNLMDDAELTDEDPDEPQSMEDLSSEPRLYVNTDVDTDSHMGDAGGAHERSFSSPDKGDNDDPTSNPGKGVNGSRSPNQINPSTPEGVNNNSTSPVEIKSELNSSDSMSNHPMNKRQDCTQTVGTYAPNANLQIDCQMSPKKSTLSSVGKKLGNPGSPDLHASMAGNSMYTVGGNSAEVVNGSSHHNESHVNGDSEPGEADSDPFRLIVDDYNDET